MSEWLFNAPIFQVRFIFFWGEPFITQPVLELNPGHETFLVVQTSDTMSTKFIRRAVDHCGCIILTYFNIYGKYMVKYVITVIDHFLGVTLLNQPG